MKLTVEANTDEIKKVLQVIGSDQEHKEIQNVNDNSSNTVNIHKSQAGVMGLSTPLEQDGELLLTSNGLAPLHDQGK
jgi:hypothetical protein